MTSSPLDDLLDRLVAEYSDRLARGGSKDAADLVQRVPEEHRPALARCLRMIEAGLSTAPRATQPLAAGTTLDKYRIVREIGRGGMSIVYLAVQLDLKRQVALKVLRPGLALDARHVDRFRREALSIARLQHPHIVQVYAVGEERGWHWLAMEYVEGRNLAQVYAELDGAGDAERVEKKRWTAENLARAAGVPGIASEDRSYETALAALLAPVARAIGLAHEIGILHRDIKPSNILIHKDGRALIADFGLAKGDGDPGLSLTGEPLGTPYYMSPEQAQLSESKVDQRTDVYSLGVTLYEGLSGRRPFEGDTPLAVLDAIRTGLPASLSGSPSRPSRDAQAVVERAMAREPAQRYSTALDLAADLGALAEGRPTQAGVMLGGLLRRARRRLALASAAAGRPHEIRSRIVFLGLPLYHLHLGPRRSMFPMRVAKGWFAMGDVAIGGIAIGQFATGVLAMGGVATGGVCFGGIAAGVLALGGVSAGLAAAGGLATGYLAAGGVSLGHFAAGGQAFGHHLLSPLVQDPAAVEMFQRWMPWAIELISPH